MGHMEEPYALPLDDLLPVLQAAGKSYRARAALPASLLPFPARRGESLVAEVLVQGGTIHSCVIRDALGAIRLEGAKAFASVRAKEQLVWMVQQVHLPEAALSPAFSAAVTPPATSPWFSSLALPWAARAAPVRVQRESVPFEQMTRRQRRIWLLIDGRRTIHDLAPLLGTPLEELDQELTVLERHGLITSGHPRQERR